MLFFKGELIEREHKSVHKSVRMRSSVYEYVISFPGKNFSEKLENLIIEHGNSYQVKCNTKLLQQKCNTANKE